jgi:hypothetical protein
MHMSASNCRLINREYSASSRTINKRCERQAGGKACLKNGMAVQPITMMRNSLGREEGGSGVPLDREAYEASVAFWDTRAPVVYGAAPSGE